MKLICYTLTGRTIDVVPASSERDWMDNSASRFAYRCLPLNIANAHGWHILNRETFVAEWLGGGGLDAVRIEYLEEQKGDRRLAISHFGHGVLTFHVDAIFRTEPGFDLIATGPFNSIKDGIQPLTGVVETDWSPFTFTMNWKFTRPNQPVRFEAGEPICLVMPYRRSDLEETEPCFLPLESDRATYESFSAWTRDRASFNQRLKDREGEARAQGWQKEYFRGEGQFGSAPDSHRTKLRLREFTAATQFEPVPANIRSFPEDV